MRRKGFSASSANASNSFFKNFSNCYPRSCGGKELRDKAAKYRAIARLTTDEATAKRILELTEGLESQARGMERGK